VAIPHRHPAQPPAPPAVADIPAEIQAAWADILGTPTPPPLETGITAAWNPIPPEPDISPLQTDVTQQVVWDDILGAIPEANVSEKQVPLLERIAIGIEAVARKEGVVIEEVKL
jgi:hypothetical protein